MWWAAVDLNHLAPAVDGAERCASNWEILSVEAGVMWCEMSRAVEISRGVLAACSCQRALVWARLRALTKSQQTRSRNLNSPEPSGNDHSSHLGRALSPPLVEPLVDVSLLGDVPLRMGAVNPPREPA